MNSNQERIKVLFEAARQLSSPKERAAYLDRACGEEPELRRKIEAMLESIAAADEFFGNNEPPDQRNRLNTAPEDRDPIDSSTGSRLRNGASRSEGQAEAPGTCGGNNQWEKK